MKVLIATNSTNQSNQGSETAGMWDSKDIV